MIVWSIRNSFTPRAAESRVEGRKAGLKRQGKPPEPIHLGDTILIIPYLPQPYHPLSTSCLRAAPMQLIQDWKLGVLKLLPPLIITIDDDSSSRKV